MSMSTVSASVDDAVKATANAYLKKAGYTPNKFIHDMWESIARTGVVPQINDIGKDMESTKRKAAIARLDALTQQVPRNTELTTMSVEDMKEALSRRDI